MSQKIEGDITPKKHLPEALEKNLWKKGQSGNPAGRPKGSISIKDRIRQILENEPDTFEEVVRYYIKDKRMRDLLWRMLDGNPTQATDVTSGGEKIDFNVKLTDGNNTPPETVSPDEGQPQV